MNPLVIGNGDVEVAEINSKENFIHLVIKVPQPPHFPLTESATKVIVAEKVQFACRYLNQEGFLEGHGPQWRVKTQIVKKT